MDVHDFSPNILWSYNREKDIEPEVVVRQVIAFGEVRVMKPLHSRVRMVSFITKVIPGLSPGTYTESQVYTKDIEENSVGSHLCPAEIVEKEQIAAFISGELREIREEI